MYTLVDWFAIPSAPVRVCECVSVSCPVRGQLFHYMASENNVASRTIRCGISSAADWVDVSVSGSVIGSVARVLSPCRHPQKDPPWLSTLRRIPPHANWQPLLCSPPFARGNFTCSIICSRQCDAECKIVVFCPTPASLSVFPPKCKCSAPF